MKKRITSKKTRRKTICCTTRCKQPAVMTKNMKVAGFDKPVPLGFCKECWESYPYIAPHVTRQRKTIGVAP